jgi:hypothetical protein
MENFTDITREVLGLGETYEFRPNNHYRKIDLKYFEIVRETLSRMGIWVSQGVPTKLRIEFKMEPDVKLSKLPRLFEKVRSREKGIIDYPGDLYYQIIGDNNRNEILTVGINRGVVFYMHWREIEPLDHPF